MLRAVVLGLASPESFVTNAESPAYNGLNQNHFDKIPGD